MILLIARSQNQEKERQTSFNTAESIPAQQKHYLIDIKQLKYLSSH